MTMASWARVLLAAGIATGPIPAAPRAGPPSADARLKAIYTSEYAWRQRQLATDEDSPKDTPPHLPDVGPAAQAAKLARWTAVSAQLAAIAPATLSPTARIDEAVYQGQIDALLAEQRFRDYESR